MFEGQLFFRNLKDERSNRRLIIILECSSYTRNLFHISAASQDLVKIIFQIING